uniref:CBS domain-containing protein n=1 Tax=Chamaesiphon sp. OTE_8_metabat_110 TaxID=2964696 RepID=UPI00286BB553
LSSLVTQIRSSIADLDVLILTHEVPAAAGKNRVTIIGRSKMPGVDLQVLFGVFGGGGHPSAAAASLHGVDVSAILGQLLDAIEMAIPQPPTARDLMSAPIRTIRPETTIAEAQRILLRYGHSGLPIVDPTDKLVGIISRRDLDLARHHGFDRAPVKGYMTTHVKTIDPSTTLPEIEQLMVTHDLGRLPVLAAGKLVGIVTRTDVLRQLHHQRNPTANLAAQITVVDASAPTPSITPPRDLQQLQVRLAPKLWELLMLAARLAQQSGWHLYLVGGAVRDLLLAPATGNLVITDIDLVVDGCDRSADVGAGVQLATALQEVYPDTRLDIHGAFQTAALLWHRDPEFDSLGIDIATARTEFYPYPAANPEVEASSIRQDLYRRDFTINAMALRLTAATTPPLLDFFGGVDDLNTRQVRVLHANSFIEDPTRIYRGVRFAVRLGFRLEARTIEYIRYAIESGVYDRTAQANPKTPALQTRLKTELKYLLQASYWQPALELLGELDALQCIHPTLKLDRELLQQLKLLARCLQRFDRSHTIVHWQLRLELIIATLTPAYRQQVAANLQLSEDSIDRLQHLERSQTKISSSLPTLQRVSEVVQLLQPYDLQTLILVAVRCRNTAIVRDRIWKYLTVWSNIQPILNGKDLHKLGYKPGPQYRQILDSLLMATLDGEVTDRSSAEQFLQRHWHC